MTRRHLTLLVLATAWIALPPLGACEIRVRDSAFRSIRDVHKLCVIANGKDETAQAIEHGLIQWLEQADGTLNLKIVRINADDPSTNWQTLGIPSAPPSLPVTVLVGRNNGIGENFVIDHYDPSPSESELAAIIESPVRKQLAWQLTQNVAVLLYAPREVDGASPTADRLESIVESGIEGERIGLSMITVDRSDPAERLLCRFMGLRSTSPDTLCVAFGRGKLMSPPLVGAQIDAENIDKLVTQIRQSCSCSQPLPTMGVDLPLIWSDDIDSTVVLMDQELDLAELEAELQNKQLGKDLEDANAEPTVVLIPPGRQTSTPVPASHSLTKRFVLTVVGAAIASAIAILLVIHHRRLSHVDSA